VGIRLIVEVLTGAPEALTHREKLLLVVLAEDANDDTRITWNSVERPEVLRGAKLSRSQLYAVLKSLTAKGAIEKLAAGQKNGTAKYRIAKFPDFQCQGIRDIETPPQRPGTPDTDRSQGPGTPDTETNGQCQGNADTEPSQCQGIRDVSVRESGTPTPLNPSTTTPLASKQEGQPQLDGFGIPEAARPLVDGITAAGIYVRWPFKGNAWFPILAMIAKSGVPAMVDHALKAAARTDVQSAKYFLQGWSELPPMPAPGTERPQLRAVSGGYQPYRNPTDQSVYDEEL
jgi:Fe2+ or Zn2+ uptake regulation protein